MPTKCSLTRPTNTVEMQLTLFYLASTQVYKLC